MKRRKTTDKYHKLTESKPICPICGEHTYETEYEDARYKLDGEEFVLKEQFFRCYKNPGDTYATPEMVDYNTNQLRAYMLRKEVEKKSNDNNRPYTGMTTSQIKFKED